MAARARGDSRPDGPADEHRIHGSVFNGQADAIREQAEALHKQSGSITDDMKKQLMEEAHETAIMLTGGEADLDKARKELDRMKFALT